MDRYFDPELRSARWRPLVVSASCTATAAMRLPLHALPHSCEASVRAFAPPTGVGVWVPRNIEAIHLANGWNNGVGYHFMVDQAGTIYEGRGWDNIGAHSPPHNTDGLGVYVAIGGDQKPTDAALASVRALYDEACKKTGRTLYKRWHGYDYATACPGPHLIAWVKAGMPVKSTTPAASTPKRDEYDMASLDDLRKIVREHAGAQLTDKVTLSPGTAKAIGWGDRKNPTMTLGGILQNSLRLSADAAAGITRTREELAALADEIERQ